MTPLATSILMGFGLGIGVLVWRVTTLRTDQPGFVRIASYHTMVEAQYTMDILVREGVRVSLDPHAAGRAYSFLWTRAKRQRLGASWRSMRVCSNLTSRLPNSREGSGVLCVWPGTDFVRRPCAGGGSPAAWGRSGRPHADGGT
jgi:hypothetical protein